MASKQMQLDWLRCLGIAFGAPMPPMNEHPLPGPSNEPMERCSASSSTLKRNPKTEPTRNDLIKLVTYFEGEIQARDVAIAVLKSERLKQIVHLGRYKPAVCTDPYIALLRDSIADKPTARPPFSEKEMHAAAIAQQQSLENLSAQQKFAHEHMMRVMKEAEIQHKKVLRELEEEKSKHEHDTAQGDDITYGLEMERTRLRQELEMERNHRRKLEKELKKHLDMAKEERARQKQIVLLLLGERKKIIVKYIEERKRSEDLAQILFEEKSRIDTMAEGLEEESKKSLQMEAELEKQACTFEAEKRSLNLQLSAREARCVELEQNLQKLRLENDSLRNSRAFMSTPDPTMVPMVQSSVAKVVQPTATVSSVPVLAPTTGFAQSVSPGQCLRSSVGPGPIAPPSKAAPSAMTTTARSGFSPFGASRLYTQASTEAQPTIYHNLASGVPATIGLGTNTYAVSSPLSNVQQKKAVVNVPICRGVPPPIPPNKPIIAAKQMAPRPPRCEQAIPSTSVSSTAASVTDVPINVDKKRSHSIGREDSTPITQTTQSAATVGIFTAK